MKESEILNEIRMIFKKQWTERAGRKIPDTPDLELGNDALVLEGSVLYADMADSTGLVNNFKPWFAAEVYKAYLLGACRVIRINGGEVTAFDGDRVMAVFIGDNKNSSAAKAGLQINSLVRKVNQELKKAYPSTSYTLRQTVGIDASSLFVARTGIRNFNDLVWVGRAANYAAKLCDLGTPAFPTYITDTVYSRLNKSSKCGGKPQRNMWEKYVWAQTGQVVYRSSWWWSL